MARTCILRVWFLGSSRSKNSHPVNPNPGTRGRLRDREPSLGAWDMGDAQRIDSVRRLGVLCGRPGGQARATGISVNQPLGQSDLSDCSWPTPDLEPPSAQARSPLHTGHPERPTRSRLHAPWRRTRPIRYLKQRLTVRRNGLPQRLGVAHELVHPLAALQRRIRRAYRTPPRKLRGGAWVRRLQSALSS